MQMTMLDHVQHTTPSSPATWSAEIVRERLVEAFAIDRRMPGERRYGRMASAWPASPLHSFADQIHWGDDDARKRVWESWERGSGASAVEVSRMEQALGWLGWVPMTERRCLESWALATATNRSVSALLAKRGLARSTFYRHRDHAAQRIADRLNKTGVDVR
jgi:hypothetical protein